MAQGKAGHNTLVPCAHPAAAAVAACCRYNRVFQGGACCSELPSSRHGKQQWQQHSRWVALAFRQPTSRYVAKQSRLQLSELRQAQEGEVSCAGSCWRLRLAIQHSLVQIDSAFAGWWFLAGEKGCLPMAPRQYHLQLVQVTQDVHGHITVVMYSC
jgi:hypothetical protein